MSRPEFLLFGDSLTQQSFETSGWGAQLVDAYSRKIDVINRGYSGYNTRWTRPIFTKSLQSRPRPPLFLTIWLGANDAALPDRLASWQNVPLEEYQANLQQMIQEAQSGGVQKILLITPPPVDEAVRVACNQQEQGVSEATSLPERANAAVEQYGQACKRAGQATGVPVLDMFSQFSDSSHDWKQRFLNDGLHFTPAGQERVYGLLINSIAAHYPELNVHLLRNDYPDFENFAKEDPMALILGT